MLVNFQVKMVFSIEVSLLMEAVRGEETHLTVGYDWL